jgi:hypothetical protein
VGDSARTRLSCPKLQQTADVVSGLERIGDRRRVDVERHRGDKHVADLGEQERSRGTRSAVELGEPTESRRVVGPATAQQDRAAEVTPGALTAGRD